MFTTGTLFGFVAASLVVLLVPGPAVLYVVATSLRQGRRAGLISVAGLSAGACVHVVAATAGLSALLLASATAFGVVKAAGAAYLIYLGVRLLIGSAESGDASERARRPPRRLFRDGVVVSILNPKIAVFFLAFLPQFADPGRGSVAVQVLLLGLLYVGLALITDGAYALLSGSLRARFGERFAGGAGPRYVSGTVYIGLGIGTALADRHA